MINKKIQLAVVIAGFFASAQVFAHQTYNITSFGSNGLGIQNSVNNTDGISNFDGYSQGAAAANHWIPGTGGLPADYTGVLPFNWYSGQHDTTTIAQTTRSFSTGTSETAPNSLWKAAYTDTVGAWASYAPATTSSASTAQHPYLAVGGDSWEVGSTAGGLDYGLIHASCGTNNFAQNCTTAASKADPNGTYEIDITVKRDSNYNNVNDPNALLNVALYRGSDTSTTADRQAAFDPNAAGVQGSSLGIGDSALLWTAHQNKISDVLSFSLIIDYNEWLKTDKLLGGVDDGKAGYYTLIIGAQGGAKGSAVAYTVDSHSFSVVPVPGAVWLFGSALGAFGMLRRKNTA